MILDVKISAEELARGLRPSKRVPRNSKYLVECQGAKGLNNVLTSLGMLQSIDVEALGISFPFPQIFVFSKAILVCTNTSIYELVKGVLVLMKTVNSGGPWRALDFHEIVYLSNGEHAILRDHGLYNETTVLPKTTAMCNFNGQILVVKGV